MKEEVIIYKSLKKTVPYAILGILMGCCFAFFALSDDDISTKGMIFAWCGILFFGFGGAFMLVSVLRSRLCGKPDIAIYDDRIEVGLTDIFFRYKVWVYPFNEIERFTISKFGRTKVIKGQMMLQSSSRQVQFICDDMSMSEQAICDLLNDRLHDYKSAK